jgi:site-specific recombinase XerD
VEAFQQNDGKRKLVFGNDQDQVPSLTSFVQKCFYRDIQRTGVKMIRFHDIRHTFATNYIIHGGRIEDLQLILGHSDLTTTKIYIHLAENYLRDKMDVVNFMASPPTDPHNVIDLNQRRQLKINYR